MRWLENDIIWMLICVLLLICVAAVPFAKADEMLLLFRHKPKKIVWTYTATSGTLTHTWRLSLPAGKEVVINWGDGTSTTVTGPVTTTNYAHTYGAAGVYTVQMSGDYNSLTSILCINPGLSGDIANLSGMTNMTFLSLRDTKAFGDISNLSCLTLVNSLYFFNTDVFGDISNLSGLTLMLYLQLFNTHVEGDVASLSSMSSALMLRLQNTNIDTYTTGTLPDWKGTEINLSNLGLDQTEVSNFLCDLDNATGTPGNGTLTMSGNTAPNAAGTICKNNLIGKLWAVTTD